MAGRAVVPTLWLMCRVIGDIRLVSVGAGALALTHRPRVKALPGIRAAGATEALARLRAVTAEGVGQQRLAWAEELAALARRTLTDAG